MGAGMSAGLDDKVLALVREADAHIAAGRREEAEAALRAALELRPDDPRLLHNLGVLVAGRGDAGGAIALWDRALAAEPGYVSAQLNRANALRALGRDVDAIDGFRAVLALDPEHAEAHRALAFLWLARGDRDRAMDHFARTYDLRRGEDRTGIAARSLHTASRDKLMHDAALFRHLPPRARDGQRFELLARVYELVAAELPEDGAVELSADQLDRLGDGYNGPVHAIDAPETVGGAVNEALDGAAIEASYRANPPGVAWFDDLLTPKALALLRRYLLESTIWHDFTHIGGFVATYLEDGLACPLFLQIADEIRAALPGLLAARPLTQAWAFKGLRGTEPIDLHADDAAISLNFWVTPDAANRDPDRGGLVVYRATPPADWEMTDYDADKAGIRAFLAGHADSAVRIPYRQNRAVLFASRLFHGSDAPDFEAGYENHRINITMLFGAGADAAEGL